MATDAIHERLRRTRLARGEGIDSIARRTGLRPAWLRAMESARYEELPRGIYARSAVKAFAEALGLDPRAVIAEIEPHLPGLDDPIEGLARIRGMRPSSAPAAPLLASGRRPVTTGHAAADRPSVWTSLKRDGWLVKPAARMPSWRPFAASAIDASIVVTMLAVVVLATLAIFRIPVHALGAGARPAFGFVGAVIGVWYFSLFGGVAGQTAGTRLIGVAAQRSASRVDLPTAGVRALRSALPDVQVFEELFARGLSFTASGKPSASPHDTRPVGQAIR